MNFLKKNSVSIFFGVWLLINFMQAGATELLDDEAYYWIYSRFLEWGYYDHPPMIAVLIKAGYALFSNEFGVRLLITVMSTATLAIIYKLLPTRNDGLFFAIACSMGLLQIGGILAVPDIPLAFFVALFFWQYKRFLSNSNISNGLLLGICMVLMLYSKYHGVLIILFTLASNPSLFKKIGAWIAALTGAALFLPHLLWQLHNDWPSVHYHLFERNAGSYKISFTIEYVLGQLLIAGPIMGWLLLWKGFAYGPQSKFERALKYSLLGFYGFFLLSSFKAGVEANWTVPAFVPLIILAHQSLATDEKWKNILWRSTPVSLLVVMLLRLYLMIDVNADWYPHSELHQNKVWTKRVHEKAGNRPVVFISTYQQASKYWFYTKQPAMSLNTPYYRRNNFNFWPIEDSFRGKQTYVVSKWNFSYFMDTIQMRDGITGGRLIDSFYAESRINVKLRSELLRIIHGVLQPTAITVSKNGSLASPQSLVTLNSHRPSLDMTLFIFEKEKMMDTIPVVANHRGLNEYELKSARASRLPPGSYNARFAVPNAVWDNASLNSSTYKVKVD